MHPQFFWALLWAFMTSLVVASTESPVDLVVRTNPGKTASDTLRAIRRSIANARVEGRKEKFSNSTSLEKSFDNAVLFKL